MKWERTLTIMATFPFFIVGYFAGAIYNSLYCGFVWAGWIAEGKEFK